MDVIAGSLLAAHVAPYGVLRTMHSVLLFTSDFWPLIRWCISWRLGPRFFSSRFVHGEISLFSALSRVFSACSQRQDEDRMKTGLTQEVPLPGGFCTTGHGGNERKRAHRAQKR